MSRMKLLLESSTGRIRRHSFIVWFIIFLLHIFMHFSFFFVSLEVFFCFGWFCSENVVFELVWILPDKIYQSSSNWPINHSPLQGNGFLNIGVLFEREMFCFWRKKNARSFRQSSSYERWDGYLFWEIFSENVSKITWI